MKKYSKILISIFIVALLSGLMMWKLNANKSKIAKNATLAEQKLTVFPVTLENPIYQNIPQNFQAEGTFVPNHQLKFASEQAGRVVSLFIKKGDFVEKGQKIAILDNEQVTIDMRLAQATFEKVKADLSKLETMLAANAVQKQQVEDVRLQVKSAENRVENLQRLLRKSVIYAPISGVVNDLSIEIGSYLSPATTIAEIVDINTLKLQVYLLDSEVLTVKKGQSVNIAPDLYSNVHFKGIVTAIGAIADGSRKFPVEITLANNGHNPLKAGMTGKVVFNTGATKNIFVITTNSIVGGLQEPHVYVLEGEKALLKTIQIGLQYGEKIEIVSGLNTTDKVIASGQLNLSNGASVKVIK